MILGGEQFLPFARNRITQLKKLRLPYASQSYEVDGVSIKVRIEPGHEYIRLEGGGVPGLCITFQESNTTQNPTSDHAGSTDSVSTVRRWYFKLDRHDPLNGAGAKLIGTSVATITSHKEYDNEIDYIKFTSSSSTSTKADFSSTGKIVGGRPAASTTGGAVSTTAGYKIGGNHADDWTTRVDEVTLLRWGSLTAAIPYSYHASASALLGLSTDPLPVVGAASGWVVLGGAYAARTDPTGNTVTNNFVPGRSEILFWGLTTAEYIGGSLDIHLFKVVFVDGADKTVAPSPERVPPEEMPTWGGTPRDPTAPGVMPLTQQEVGVQGTVMPGYILYGFDVLGAYGESIPGGISAGNTQPLSRLWRVSGTNTPHYLTTGGAEENALTLTNLDGSVRYGSKLLLTDLPVVGKDPAFLKSLNAWGQALVASIASNQQYGSSGRIIWGKTAIYDGSAYGVTPQTTISLEFLLTASAGRDPTAGWNPPVFHAP